MGLKLTELDPSILGLEDPNLSKLRLKPHEHKFFYLNSRIEDIDLNPDDITVSVHACGRLTDTIVETAVNAGTGLAVLPCCHDTKIGDLSGIGGWVEGKSP